MTQRACCIEECKSSSAREQDRGVTFHRLPKEENIRSAWISQGRLNDKIQQPDDGGGSNKTHYYVCSRHFRKVDFELKIDKASKFILKTGSIPTIFPWGVTELQELPTLFPNLTSNDEQQPESTSVKDAIEQSETKSSVDLNPVSMEESQTKEGTEMSTDKEKEEKINATEDSSSTVVSKKVAEKAKEGYSSSADAESDKDAFEGNLVIDETAFNPPEQPVPKKRRRRKPTTKAFVRKQRKIKITPLDTCPTNSITAVEPDEKPIVEPDKGIKVEVVRQPQARRPRGRRKKNLDDELLKSNISQSGGTNEYQRTPKSPPIHKAKKSKIAFPQIPPDFHDSMEERKYFAENDNKSLMIPGAIVEAKDFSEQWYPAKVLEVDHDEKEVLIHYDNWSQRYDEWISMASPRLRLVAPPQRSPRIPPTPIIYSQGERCLARWSDNRRFPATIQTVLPDNKYRILFDDGFVRVMKWQHLAKGQASMETSTCFSPLPYGSRRSAPSLPAAPSTPPPPPLHTHLFDPKRDHLGSKEERRNKKRKINVKELFSPYHGKRKRSEKMVGRPCTVKGTPGRKKRVVPLVPLIVPKVEESKSKLEEYLTAPTIQPENTMSITPQLIKKLVEPDAIVKEEVKRADDQQVPNTEKQAKNETSAVPRKESTERSPLRPGPDSQHVKQPLEKIRTKLPKQLKSEKTPLAKRQTLGDVPKRKYKSRTASPAVTDSVSSKVKKEEIQLPCESLNMRPEDLSRLLKDEWSCKWVDNQPVGEVTVLPPLERGTRAATGDDEGASERLSRMTVKVEDYRLPPDWSKYLTRRCVGNSAGKWDVVLMCPQGRRYRSKAEITTRLHEADGPSLLSYQKCLQDFSVHRKLARRLGWDMTSSGAPATTPLEISKKKFALSCSATPNTTRSKAQTTTDSVTSKSTHEDIGILKPKTKHGITKLKTFSGHGTPKSKYKNILQTPEIPSNVTTLDTTLSTPVNISTPSVPEQPPLEDGFIYVGSLKVQIIGTLLRCPKEGCFKNFRKDNLLQMHIKHYHPEMIDLLGDTPNVADLAYARTIVEDVTPVKSIEKPHRHVREKKSSLPAVLSKVYPDDIEIKEEFDAELIAEKMYSDLTPNKDLTHSDALENSPKLRNLLLEPKTDSLTKLQSSDVEDVLQTFKIKQDPDSNPLKVKFEKTPAKSTKPKHSKSSKSDKELTKSQVMALINKIAEGGDRSRSTSPIDKRDDRSYEGKKSDKMSQHRDPPPPPLKVKKKRKHNEDNDADFKPSAGRRKKKKSSSYLDIWNTYVSNIADNNSGYLASNDTSINNAPLTESSIPEIELPKAEKGHEDHQGFFNDNGEKIKIVHMKREEIINCYCGFGEEDGLMIQCELCLCWQHAVCHEIEKESQVPDKYICHICLYPPRGRKSQRHLNNQDWLYEGRLPRLEHQALAPDPNVLNGVAPLSGVDQSRAQALKKSHQLCGNLLHVSKILHSLRCKIDVSQKKDHPKLYLWSKPWDNKADIDCMDPANIHTGHEHNQASHQQQIHRAVSSNMAMGDGGEYLDRHTDALIHSHIGPYGDISQVKMEVGESIEVSEVSELEEGEIVKCDNVMEVGGDGGRGGLLSSPGGTPIHLPITNMDLKTLVKSVQVCAPQPEAAIDSSECRQRLLQHIENLQMMLDERLDSIEAQIAELESQDPSLADDETPESYPRTKQTMQMLLRDLSTLEELGKVS